MNQGENLVLVENLEKTELLPPKLKEFLILALEEGALEKDLEDELVQMMEGGKK